MKSPTAWQKIHLGTSHMIQESSLPWVSFLLELGARTHVEARQPGRTYIVVLLPTRICASATAALGILTAAAEEGIIPLAHEELMTMPVNSKVVSFRTQDGKKRAKEWLVRPGRNQANRTLICGGEKRFVYGDSPEREQFYSECAARPKKLAMLKKVAALYQSLTSNLNDMWTYVSRCECVVVTNRARWKRELNDLYLQIRSTGILNHRVDIAQALMFGDSLGTGHVRVLLSSHGDDQPDVSYTTPVILDGPDAFLCHYSFSTRCVLCLLDKTEYDEALDQEVRQLLDRRNEKVTSQFVRMETIIPHGVDMLAFTLDEDAP